MPWTRQTIRNPSDKFQMLLYPWIENDFSSDYNASPLRSEKTASSQRSVLRLIDSEKKQKITQNIEQLKSLSSLLLIYWKQQQKNY